MSQRKAKGPPREKYRCPYCRAPVRFDDARLVSSHQAPICAGWNRLMVQSGARELGPELLEGGDDRGRPS